MKSALPLLACLSLVPAAFTAPAQDPPTPRPATSATDLDVGIPWLPPAASLEEYLLHVDIRRHLKRREKLLQLLDELELEIALAEIMEKKPTEEQRAAVLARRDALQHMLQKITTNLKATDSHLREYRARKEQLEKERAESSRQ